MDKSILISWGCVVAIVMWLIIMLWHAAEHDHVDGICGKYRRGDVVVVNDQLVTVYASDSGTNGVKVDIPGGRTGWVSCNVIHSIE